MKKNRRLIVFLVIVMIFSILLFTACTEPTDDNKDKDTEKTQNQVDGTLINNGTFKFSQSKEDGEYVQKDIVNWTIEDAATKVSDKNVQSGVIELDETKFNENKKIFSFEDKNKGKYQLDYPGIAPSTEKDSKGAYIDKNALVMFIPEIDGKAGSISAKLTNSSTLEKDTFYKLSIDVYTNIHSETEKNGASLELTSTLYSQILSINTNKKWSTYTFYIQTNKYKEASFNLKLWLGHGPQYLGQSSNSNPYLATGSVLFDNILVDKVEDKATILRVKNEFQNGQYKKDENNNVSRYLNLAVVDPSFNASADYSTYAAASTDYYYSAKKGIASQYDFHVGKKDLTSEEKVPFPEYITYTSSKFPIGIFDMSKFYQFNESNEPTDAYKKLETSFKAPNYEDFYKLVDGKMKYDLLGNGSNGRTGTSLDSTGLLIWHPNNKISGAGYIGKNKITIEKDKFYEISVWSYIWIPEMTKPADLTGADLDDPAKVKKHEQDLENYNSYMEFYNKTRAAQSTFKITGVSVEDSNKLSVNSTLEYGQWEKLTIKIRGNSLSKREISPEFWYGYGQWGDSTLVPGACIFDDLSIVEKSSVDDESQYHQLSILSEGDFEAFGLMGAQNAGNFKRIEDTEKFVWKNERVDDAELGKEAASKIAIAGVSAGNSDFIDSTELMNVDGLQGISKGPGTLTVKYGGSDQKTDVIIINHTEPSSSSIKFSISAADIAANDKLKDLMLVKSNSFYRLSFWMNTANLSLNNGAKVKVFQIDDDDETKNTELATYSSINVDEWTEYIAYIKGSATKEHRFGLSINLGEGDINTPDTRVKGVAYFTAPTWQKISYDEYTNANKGDTNTKEIAAKDSTAEKTSALSNGFFGSFESSEYSKFEKFNKDGNLIGEVKPTSWQFSEAQHGLSSVKGFKVESSNKLKWDKLKSATGYLIFMNEHESKITVDGEEKTLKQDDVLIAKIDDPETLSFTVSRNGKYYIRAIGTRGKDYNNIDYGIVFSPKTTVLSVTGAGTGEYPAKIADSDNPIVINSGIINYKYYEKIAEADRVVESMYGVARDGEYVSTNSANLLTISSKASATIQYKYNSTYTISKGSYYVVTAWVKTIDGAKASITLEDNSSTLVKNTKYSDYKEEQGEYAGFVDIDTSGKWMQYRFIIKSGYVDGRITLELALGNRYALENTDDEEDKYSKGLSKGTVYFDDINITKLADINEFNLNAYGLKDIKDVKESDYKLKENTLYSLNDFDEEINGFFANKFKFKLIDYRVDSFDSSSDANDDYLGRKPGAYTHHQPAGSTPYAKPTGDEIPKILHGIYSQKSLTSEVRSYLAKADDESSDILSLESINSFLSQSNGNGSNFLMLANIEANGQYYEMTSGFDVEKDTYYKVTFYAKLLAANNKKAQFRFIPGRDSEGNTKILEISGSQLKKYTFYIYSDEKNSTISSNKISFNIGTNDAIGKAVDGTDQKDFFKGILVVDDVSIEKVDDITAEEISESFKFDEKVKEGKAFSFAAPKETTSEEKPEETPEEEKKKGGMDSQMWLLIATIVISATLLLALIVLGVRRVKTRFAKGQKVVVKSKFPSEPQVVKPRKIESKKEEAVDDEFTDFN